MALKCCSKCAYTLPLSSFLTDPSNLKSKTLLTYIKCYTRNHNVMRRKRRALMPLNLNIPSKRPIISYTKLPIETPLTSSLYIQPKIHLELSIHPLSLPKSCLYAPLLLSSSIPKLYSLAPPLPPLLLLPSPVQPIGFLLAD